jgi:RNA polymerase-binding transcription factor
MRKNSDAVLCRQHRAALEQEYRDLQHRIRTAEEQLMRLGTGDSYSIDVSNPDQEDLIEKCSRQRRQLRVVLQGLQRLQGGTFGVCARCERPIAKKRVEALPTAEYCLTCQEQMELTGSAA